MNVGGRNLLYNSKQRITNSYYNIATYRLTEELKVGELLTITIKGQLGTGKTAFAAYNSGDLVELSQLLDKGNGIYQNTFVWRTRNQYSVSDNKTLWIWTYPSSIYVDSTIEWIKLEKGNKPTDWTPAPEDTWDTMVDLGIIDKNAMAITEAEKANIKYINGVFSKGGNYDSETGIVKNTITTGALTVGNVSGGNAGINGAGLAGNSIRFFAGKPYSQKEQAPFRVDDNGELWATNAHISGNIDAKTGQIGDLTLSGGLYSSNWDRKKNKVDGGVFFSGSGVLYRDDSKKVKASFGSIAGSIFGVNSAMFKIEKEAVKKSEYDKRYNIEYFTGQTILVPPYPNEEVDVTFKYLNDRAQFIYGDTFNFGASAKFDYVYSGLAYTNIIERWLGVTNTFIFTDVPSDMNTVRLPSATIINEILNKLGVENISRDNLGFSFEITIIMAWGVGQKRVKIQGVHEGYILSNENGERFRSLEGHFEMTKGNIVKLRYHRGDYHIMYRSEKINYVNN